MRFALAAAVLFISGGVAQAADDAETALCRSNPAYSIDVMRNVLQAQLEKDHDPALDSESREGLRRRLAAESGDL